MLLELQLHSCYVSGTLIDYRVIKSDPGRFPVHLESTAWTGGEARAVDSQLVSSPRLEGWTAKDYEGVIPFFLSDSKWRKQKLVYIL